MCIIGGGICHPGDNGERETAEGMTGINTPLIYGGCPDAGIDTAMRVIGEQDRSMVRHGCLMQQKSAMH